MQGSTFPALHPHFDCVDELARLVACLLPYLLAVRLVEVSLTLVVEGHYLAEGLGILDLKAELRTCATKRKGFHERRQKRGRGQSDDN